jgi:hypothetical protein
MADSHPLRGLPLAIRAGKLADEDDARLRLASKFHPRLSLPKPGRFLNRKPAPIRAGEQIYRTQHMQNAQHIHDAPQIDEAQGLFEGISLFTLFQMSDTFGPISAIAVMAPTTIRPHTKPHSRASVPRSSFKN